MINSVLILTVFNSVDKMKSYSGHLRTFHTLDNNVMCNSAHTFHSMIDRQSVKKNPLFSKNFATLEQNI